jgi:dTDP-4-dehydrorhamnose reductase
VVKTLITGSEGMLGSDLSGVLAAVGEIAGMDLSEPRGANKAYFSFTRAGINDPEAVKAVFAKERPDLIIHAAAWTDVDGCQLDRAKAYRVNAEGTANVANLAEEFGVPLVYISTDFVFDGLKTSPYREEDACGPINVYGESKREGEEAVIRTLSRYAILRTSWLYGRFGKNFVDTISSRIRSVGNIKVVNDQTGCPTYTMDLALAIRRLIERGGVEGKEIYHICGAGSCTWYDLAVKIKSLIPGSEGSAIEPVSAVEFARPAARPAYSVLDTSKFEAKTGFKMRAWNSALEEYLSTV